MKEKIKIFAKNIVIVSGWLGMANSVILLFMLIIGDWPKTFREFLVGIIVLELSLIALIKTGQFQFIRKIFKM